MRALETPEVLVYENYDAERDQYTGTGKALVCEGQEGSVLHRHVFGDNNCYEVEWVSFSRYLPIAEACLEEDRCAVEAYIDANNSLVSLNISYVLNKQEYLENQRQWSAKELEEAIQQTQANLINAEPFNKSIWSNLLSELRLN